MTATLQPTLLTDPLRNALTPTEIAVVEQRIEQDSERLADHAHQARGCCCGPRAYGEAHEGRCWRCGRETAVYDDATGADRGGQR
jgi:hypothetical protein